MGFGLYKNAKGIESNRGVRTQHADYVRLAPIWQRCRDVVAGQDAVHAAGTDYLPKLRKQSQQDYLAMVQRTPFYNASARTAGGLVGMLFRKPPTIEAPQGIADLLVNADMCGSPFDVFAQEIAEEVIIVGRVGVLVDHAPAPKVVGPVTVAAAQSMGLRPMMKIYKTENIINWRFASINNIWTLVQVVLAETYTQPATDQKGQPSEFEDESEIRYRVLDLMNNSIYRVRVFRINQNNEDTQVGGDVFPVIDGKPLTYIPFYVMTDDGVGFEIEEPPLLDLFNVNLSHYRTSADYEHGCHFTALPTLFISGYTAPVTEGNDVPDEIYLGSQAAIVLPNENAKALFVEFTGNGLSTIEHNLNRKEQQMSILGARMLASEGPQALTATTTAIHRVGENSVLASISIAVSLGLTLALQVFAAWAAVTGEIKYKINRDFLPVTIDGPALQGYVQTWQAGGLNDEEFFDLIQRADLIEADVTFDEHKAGDFTIPAIPPGPNARSPGEPAIKKSPNEA